MSQLEKGSPSPAGALFDGKGINFSVFSANAEQIELCLFDKHGKEERLVLPSRSGDFWHGYLPGGKPGQRYGFRASGPFEPIRGLRFNPHKLLVDPYARELEGRVTDHPFLYDGINHPDEQDSASVAPKCVVSHEEFDWGNDTPPGTPWAKTVIYEAHVRGLTRLHPDIPQEIRGTYAALAHPVMIKYLMALGITAIELQPVQWFADEARLLRLGLSNYWGYNPLAPFAVDPRYASRKDGVSALNEFRQAVKALHEAGIEVILDVVFNHTAELDLEGPTLSLRGLDNRSYYWLHQSGDYDNVTGCGNAIRLVDDAVVQWVIDCMRFWVAECHVDGFRFDLATVLGRTPTFRQDAPLFIAMQQDDLLSRCKMIAEPWDIGLGGYQLGNYPGYFAEWNDRYRDDMRRFWLNGRMPLGQFASRFAASSDVYQRGQRKPYASINMMTAHDGFTLLDLLSFNYKHNQANGENNRDGHGNNYSFNHGTEGLEAEEAVIARRRNVQRSLLATLLLSQGTPMLLAGDEQGHSQQGNNNAYCQDNEITWLNWQNADRSLTEFTAGLIRLRQQIPALQQDDWWQEGKDDVRWLNAQGRQMNPQRWERGPQQQLQILLSSRWLVMINAADSECDMALPQGVWVAVHPFNQEENHLEHALWRAPAHSICVFAQE